MKKILVTFSLLLCLGELSHAASAVTYSYDVEWERWLYIYQHVGNKPLDSSEPITVKITGPADADGYPTGEVYYNDVFACGTNYYRYFPSFVSYVAGQGWSPDYLTEAEPTSLVVNSNGAFDYGWAYDDGHLVATFGGWVNEKAISFYGDCGSHKLGVSIKDLIKLAETDGGRSRARLVIDRLLYSSNSLDDINQGSSMWWYNNVDYDQYRIGRAYYYLYLTKSTKSNGYSCESGACDKINTDVYGIDKDGESVFSFAEYAPSFAPVKVYSQRRHYTLANGKYVAGDWTTKYVGTCYGTGESGSQQPCHFYRDATISRSNDAYKGDSLVEFRRMWQTTIATGSSAKGGNDAAHYMEVYDTTYSKIVKLLPKYRIAVNTSDKGRLGKSVNGDYTAGTNLSVSAIPNDGYAFKCWSTDENGTNCVSTESQLNLTVRYDTTLYATYSEKPLKLILDASCSSRWYVGNENFLGCNHVLGHDIATFDGFVSGTNRKAYFACEYRYNSNTWQRLGSVYEIPAEKVAYGIRGYIDIDKASEVTCRIAKTVTLESMQTLGSMQMKFADSTEFRMVVSYNQNMSNAVYSNTKYALWRYPVVFRDTGNKVIATNDIMWGESVELPSWDQLKIPVDDDANGIYYDFGWTSLNRTMAAECGKISSTATSATITDIDSLMCYPEILHGYRVKFVDADGTVLKDTVVKESLAGSYSLVLPYFPVPEAPDHEYLQFIGWDHEVNSGNNIVNITEPLTVTALYDTLSYMVLFVDDDGETLKQGYVEKGQSATAPEVSKYKSGRVFSGWSEDFSSVQHSMTITAQYLPVPTIEITLSDLQLSKMKVSVNVPGCFEIKNSDVSNSSGKKFIWNATLGMNSEGSCSKDKLVQSVDALRSVEGAKLPVTVNGKAVDSIAVSTIEKFKVEFTFAAKDIMGVENATPVPQFTLAALGRDIQVSGARVGSAYAVFDMQGRVMKQGRVESANFGFSMPRAGTYLVRISGQTRVVKLK